MGRCQVGVRMAGDDTRSARVRGDDVRVEAVDHVTLRLGAALAA
jgi:hypothetical protein